jgi:hypothetical protein
MVSNVQTGFPMEIALGRNTPSINAREWPTADAIAESLAGYHRAKSELQRAYDAIPESQRDIVRRPDSFER